MEILKIIDYIPKGFLEIKPKEITKLIDCPTLIHLRGKKEQPLFVSILLHGNEFSGLMIVQSVLKKYKHRALPRSLIIFIANPKACEKGLRQLKDQPDFNRIWRGGSSYKESLTKPVLKYAEDQKIQVAVDIHNNTGRSPIYACINKKTEEFIKLAQTFSKTIVYFTKPDSVLSLALSRFCPSIVMECGLPGHTLGIDSGIRCIENLLENSKLENSKKKQRKKNQSQNISIYHTSATMYIAPDAEVCFHPQPFIAKERLCLISHLDKFNFKQLAVGTVLGKISDSKQIKLIDKNGLNVFNQFFSIVEHDLTVKSPFIPCMLTKNIQIAKSDCLGYIMEKSSLIFNC